jgi:outer membrane protein assembly factor BamB
VNWLSEPSGNLVGTFRKQTEELTMMRFAWFLVGLFAAGMAARVSADDWPQWLGPQRDSHWRETGIVTAFPEQGLKIKWRAPVAWGYSGPAVAGGQVFVMDYVVRRGEVTNNAGGRTKLDGTERLLCLDAETGQLRWKHEYPRPYDLSYPGGPRCTPAVDGERVYGLGAEGNLWCLSTADGRVLWSKDFVQDYGAQTPFWGVAAHPLVDGDTLYAVVGGQGSVAVAFDKRSGREIWRALSAPEPGYCAPTMIEHGGLKQLLIWHAESLNSLDPRTGRVYWSRPLKPAHGMSIAVPRQQGSLLFASSYGDVAVLWKLVDPPGVEELWRGKQRGAVYCANSSPFVEQGMIYGCDINSGMLMGVKLDTGQRLWETLEPTTGGARRGRYGTAFLVKHQDRFFLFNETGDLILARLSPEGYQELGRCHVLDATNNTFGRPVVWSHPAFAQRCLFARNDRELVCVDLAAP